MFDGSGNPEGTIPDAGGIIAEGSRSDGETPVGRFDSIGIAVKNCPVGITSDGERPEGRSPDGRIPETSPGGSPDGRIPEASPGGSPDAN